METAVLRPVFDLLRLLFLESDSAIGGIAESAHKSGLSLLPKKKTFFFFYEDTRDALVKKKKKKIIDFKKR